MLYGKSVVLGVSGGIACYKACEIVSRLKKLGAQVDVIMTKNATEFVSPLTFQTLAKTPVVCDTFTPVEDFDINHISLAKKADVFVVAPATANVIAKFAKGIADDMLSTTYLACNAPKLICPAMNVNMYEDDATQSNLRTLASRGAVIFEPDEGLLACGDVGKGRLAEPVEVVARIVNILTPTQDYHGKRVLVSAGGTEEDIDGVRVIANHSSGKMGCAIAQAAAERGAEVTLVCGNMKVAPPQSAAKIIKVRTTCEMYDAVVELAKANDIIIMAAAPADYKPKQVSSNKIKTDTLTLELVKNPDIAAAVGAAKDGGKLVIFSAETENLLENAVNKLKKKNADMVVANDVTLEGAGFDVDTNIATVIDALGNRTECGLLKKSELANVILDKVLELK